MNEDTLNQNQEDVSPSSNLSNILIGILLVVVAFLAFNFFQTEPNQDNSNIAQENDTSGTVDSSEEVAADSFITNEKENDDTSTDKYIVKEGDSLWKIAENELNDGFLWSEIAELNGINPEMASDLEVGTEIILPEIAGTRVVESSEQVDSDTSSEASASVNNEVYVVQRGDTLWKIAEEFYNDGFSWKKIFQLPENQLSMYKSTQGNTYPLIHQGNVLVIPEVSTN